MGFCFVIQFGLRYNLFMKSIHIVEDTLPVAWEKAVLACWEEGENFPTEYDKENDPNSRDVTALIHVKNPMAEPRIHRAFPGSLDDLEKYRSEMLYGVHNHWIDPDAGKWEYTYHERLFEYNVTETIADVEYGALTGSSSPKETIINQIDKCVDLLKQNGYTRRAQAVTWKVWKDLGISDPACLQRVWFRVQRENGKDKLNMTVDFRSNDAYRGAFFNAFALTELQKMVAEQVGVDVGEYIHIASSFHIYGSCFDEFKGFINMTKNRNPEDLVYNTEDALPFFVQACDTLLAEEDMPEGKKEKVRQRKAYLESLL